MSVRAGGRAGTGGTVAEDRQVESDGDRKARTWTGGQRTGGLDLPCKGRSAEDGSV